QALVINREIGSRQGEAVNLGNLGIIYNDVGQIDRAIECYKQALVINREIGSRHGEAKNLGNLAEVYIFLGQIDQAIEYSEQALVIDREIGDLSDEAVDLSNLGMAQATKGNYANALDNLISSIQIAQKIRSTRDICSASIYLAHIYLQMGRLEDAFNVVEEAGKYDVPEYNHILATLHGVILTCSTKSAATAFSAAISFANIILERTPTYFTALYARALAHAGLSLVQNSTINEAQRDYETALKICAAKGVINEQVQRLENLIKLENGEKLVPLRELLMPYMK
ncbi:MAG TPA: tetratricopeptide repeat protein, partial [Methylotenera sp.]|nr:tetratricopeptide repeat protein [Methylotenera sp.]